MNFETFLITYSNDTELNGQWLNAVELASEFTPNQIKWLNDGYPIQRGGTEFRMIERGVDDGRGTFTQGDEIVQRPTVF